MFQEIEKIAYIRSPEEADRIIEENVLLKEEAVINNVVKCILNYEKQHKLSHKDFSKKLNSLFLKGYNLYDEYVIKNLIYRKRELRLRDIYCLCSLFKISAEKLLYNIEIEDFFTYCLIPMPMTEVAFKNIKKALQLTVEYESFDLNEISYVTIMTKFFMYHNYIINHFNNNQDIYLTQEDVEKLVRVFNDYGNIFKINKNPFIDTKLSPNESTIAMKMETIGNLFFQFDNEIFKKDPSYLNNIESYSRVITNDEKYDLDRIRISSNLYILKEDLGFKKLGGKKGFDKYLQLKPKEGSFLRKIPEKHNIIDSDTYSNFAFLERNTPYKTLLNIALRCNVSITELLFSNGKTAFEYYEPLGDGYYKGNCFYNCFFASMDNNEEKEKFIIRILEHHRFSELIYAYSLFTILHGYYYRCLYDGFDEESDIFYTDSQFLTFYQCEWLDSYFEQKHTEVDLYDILQYGELLDEENTEIISSYDRYCLYFKRFYDILEEIVIDCCYKNKHQY